MTFIRNGWTSAGKQFPVAILIFLYQLVWGMFLFKILHNIIIPVLQRYPDPGPGELSRYLFLMEGQLGLESNSGLKLYAAIILGLALIRVIVTPLIRAGIYHSLLEEHEHQGAGWLFFEGICKRWRVVSLFYLAELLISLAPAYWIVPKLLSKLSQLLSADYQTLIYAALLLLGWGIWVYIMKRCLEYMLLGSLSRTGMINSLIWCIRKFPQVALISILLGLVSLALGASFTAGSWIWTGMLGLVIHQIYPLLSSFLGIWQIGSQFHLWRSGVKD